MKLYIDAQRDLIPTAAAGSDGCVFLHLRTCDWALHHSVVMSPAEAREIAADLLRAANEATAHLPQDPTRDNPERARAAQEESDRG